MLPCAIGATGEGASLKLCARTFPRSPSGSLGNDAQVSSPHTTNLTRSQPTATAERGRTADSPSRDTRFLAIVTGQTDEPIQSEPFGAERLEQHARSLAAADHVGQRSTPVAPRLGERRVLLAASRSIASALNEKRAITPAAEWIVDDFHIVSEEIREVRDDLNPGLYGCPELAEGRLEGYPRVFGIAWAFIPHTDSHFDPELLRRFGARRQEVTALTIGEI